MNEPHGLAARLTDVTHRYGATLALAGVTLDLPAGIVVGLIGPDGVGKSSLLGLIALARKLQSGQAQVLGRNIADARHRRAICPSVAYMPQGLWQQPLCRAQRRRKHRLLRPPVRPSRRRTRGSDRRIVAEHRAGAVSPSAGKQAVGRDEAKARPMLRVDPRP